MTTLICIRHGQSEINLARRLTGQLDSPLTPLGVEQARRTAEFLRSQPITRIYSSDLVRCMDTAAPTAAMHGLPVIPEPAFREIFAGKWEGMTFDAITAAYPESHHIWMTDMGRAHPDGGESVAQLYDRVTTAMERIVRENEGGCVAIFTHSTPIRTMACRWKGLPVEQILRVPWASNASVSIADWADGHYTVRLYGYDKHQGAGVTELPKNI